MRCLLSSRFVQFAVLAVAAVLKCELEAPDSVQELIVPGRPQVTCIHWCREHETGGRGDPGCFRRELLSFGSLRLISGPGVQREEMSRGENEHTSLSEFHCVEK